MSNDNMNSKLLLYDTVPNNTISSGNLLR